MYKPINGWTKSKILEVIRARKFDEPATDRGYCIYLSAEGNKCGIGLFIPDGHPGQRFLGAVAGLLAIHRDLENFIPLEIIGLVCLQSSHDSESSLCNMKFNGNAKAAMLDWVKKNVE